MTITKEEVLKIIEEEIEKSLELKFNQEFDSGQYTSQYTVEVWFRGKLITSDYQVITEGDRR